MNQPDDPYRPPASPGDPERVRQPLKKEFVPVLLTPVAIAAVMALSKGIQSEKLIPMFLIGHPLAAFVCATLCAAWLRAAYKHNGCITTLLWFGFMVFYGVTFFFGCVFSLS